MSISGWDSSLFGTAKARARKERGSELDHRAGVAPSPGPVRPPHAGDGEHPCQPHL